MSWSIPYWRAVGNLNSGFRCCRDWKVATTRRLESLRYEVLQRLDFTKF
jgi:hypothetical protein